MLSGATLQQTVAMALVVATHHSAPRGEWPRLVRSPTATEDRQCRGHERCFSEPHDECGRGYRVLLAVRGRARGARGLTGFTTSGRKNVDNRLFVPTLDVPVPQMENQLVEVCRLLDFLIPEQAIEVPKISSSSRHSRRRRVRFAEQTAEQLVEVPTIVSNSMLHGHAEQNVDIPVPHGRDRVGGGLLGLHPGQSSTAFGGAELLPAATAEQIVDIPVPRGGRVLHPAASSSGFAGYGKSWGFSHFSPWEKSAQLGPHPGSELGVHAGG